MILGMYAVYDEKAAAFLTPFFMSTDGQAVRVFSDCVDDANHQFARHPMDYTLYKVGAFDCISGNSQELRDELMRGIVARQMSQRVDQEQISLNIPTVEE